MKPDCSQFLDRLDDFLEGKLVGNDREAAERHARECDDCRELLSMIGSDLAAQAEAPPPAGLAEAILERTGGRPCRSARERICDHVDGLLEGIDEELVRGHLHGCDDCKSLATVLTRLSQDLPALAEAAADETLVREILDRTAVDAGDWAVRWIESWRALLRRPRLAWEGAYLGTVLLLLLFGLPISPLSGVAGRIVSALQGDGVSRLEESVSGIDNRLSAGVRIVWDASGSKAIEACRELPADVDRLSGSVKEAIEERLGTVSGPPASISANEENEGSVIEGSPPEGEER